MRQEDASPADGSVAEGTQPAGLRTRTGGRGRSGIAFWLVRRIASALVIWILVSIMVFTLTSVLPGDVTLTILGNRATPEQIAETRERLGLDRALPVRYGQWFGQVVRGDFGRSLISNRPVIDTIASPIRNSLSLSAATLTVLIPLTLLLGLYSGARAGSIGDGAIGIVSTVLYAFPLFITATVLILLFALRLQWFPAVSMIRSGENAFTNLDTLVLPVTALVLGSASYLIRLIRAGTSETMRSDFVEFAQLRGVSQARLLLRHVLPNVLPPILQIFILYAATLFSGVIIVEAVFGYPGIGSELVRAVGARDFPIVQAIAMLAASLVIFGSVLADLLLISLTPRLREELWR